MTESQERHGIRLSEYLKAVGNPSRLFTMLHLMVKDEMTFGDLHERSKISKSTLSQHLDELKAVGLIQGRKSGQKTFYSIREEGWQDFKMLIYLMFAIYNPDLRHHSDDQLLEKWKADYPDLSELLEQY